MEGRAALLISLVVLLMTTLPAPCQLVGGYSDIDDFENNDSVIKAASKVESHAQTQLQSESGSTCTVTNKGITKAQSQVVAGTNFKVELVLSSSCNNGPATERTCTAVIFKPLPFRCNDDSGCMDVTSFNCAE